jgi:uncharacterized membrane-anchored protein YhcB (DUF1043 family)
MKKSNFLFILFGFILGFILGNLFSRNSNTNIDKDLKNYLDNVKDKFSIEKASSQIFDTVKKISDAFESGKKSIEEDNDN